MRQARTASAALAVIAALAALAGCGDLEPEFRGARAVPPPPVTQAALERHPPGGPARALLSWCRDLQAGTGDAAARWPAGAAFFASASCPAILDVRRDGDRATAFTAVERRWVAPNGRRDANVQAQAFRLVRGPGGWAVTPDPFLSARGATPRARGRERVALPRLVGSAEVAAQPAGGPARAGLELLRALQFNDPVGAAPRFAPVWRLAPARIAGDLPRYGRTLRDWGVPRVVSVRPRGERAVVVADLDTVRAELLFARGGKPARWQLARLRIGPLVAPEGA